MSALLERDYINLAELKERFIEIEDQLIRYPSINPLQFRAKLDDFIAKSNDEK